MFFVWEFNAAIEDFAPIGAFNDELSASRLVKHRTAPGRAVAVIEESENEFIRRVSEIGKSTFGATRSATSEEAGEIVAAINASGGVRIKAGSAFRG